jgi:riboflavin biosynthesis pyrimidine reductase
VDDNGWRDRFVAFAERKAREADAASISALETAQAGPGWTDGTEIGNDWSRRFYDGGFTLPPVPDGRPSVSLIFVRSRDGNTGGREPSRLGGGDIDKHLIYEGLSRVGADAVMSGATTVSGQDTFFSVWRQELVDLRASLGLPRHPAQIVASQDGHLDVEGTLLFNVPEVPVIVLAGPGCRERCAEAFAARRWVAMIPIDDADWHGALARVRQDHGIKRISAIGGRQTATSLIDAGVIQDVCLTTTGVTGGEPDTPFYTGLRPPTLELVVRKQSKTEYPILFEHLAVASQK